MIHTPNKQSYPDLVFLKLGGSLITDKDQPRTVRKGVLTRLAGELAQAWEETPSLTLLLGHGSGSFGHVSGEKYHTRGGVHSEADWRGFTKVWFDAARLNHLVMTALHQINLPAISFPPSTWAITKGRSVIQWNTAPLHHALENHLLPVVYGDVTFNRERGGTILSTEEIFANLATEFSPRKIFLAGVEPGVWADYPQRSQITPEITPETYPEVASGLQGAAATDVTGGMAGKVRDMIGLVEGVPEVEVWIFSALEDDRLYQALTGNPSGTRIYHP